jgi:hypothetical protein
MVDAAEQDLILTVHHFGPLGAHNRQQHEVCVTHSVEPDRTQPFSPMLVEVDWWAAQRPESLTKLQGSWQVGGGWKAPEKEAGVLVPGWNHRLPGSSPEISDLWVMSCPTTS